MRCCEDKSGEDQESCLVGDATGKIKFTEKMPMEKDKVYLLRRCVAEVGDDKHLSITCKTKPKILLEHAVEKVGEKNHSLTVYELADD